MEDVVVSQQRTLDNIILEKEYKHSVYITIGLIKGGDFRIILEFNDVDIDSLKKLNELFNLSKALEITSDILTKENYNVTHIVVEKFSANNQFKMIWECLSDDPNLSLEL